ncbi:MAG: anthranilate synthase component I [Nitrospinaceae bacterium]|jgi:anthranilate synthase component I|nr:anthranilate synthase component I [Nitrospinaceae bacterium]MBT3435433.1 anthranilate synthase component I [Nitrospinaceae bacterium]MBT3820922.1 anthranilate synthase component I [Nitrospinaceae bacterium]MBT4095098.1 anthranilate synthase component I [Nitrospinaceae bacterium]MBT4429672.1 anthranilate synthase component I [Nitrospinaceae bacterium]
MQPLQYVPDKESFVELARKGNIIPVYREIMADMETPVSAYLKIADDPYSFLLESVEGGEKWARYCFLGSRPFAIFESKGREVRITRQGKSESYKTDDPIEALREMMKNYRCVDVPGLPRFWGGAVGYFSYDMIRFIERLPDEAVDDLGMAESCFMFTDTMIIFDHVSQRMKVVAMAHLGEGDPEAAYNDAVARVDALVERVNGPRVSPPAEPQDPPSKDLSGEPVVNMPGLNSSFSKDEFEERVAETVEMIHAGEAIQVVLSQRLESALDVHPFAIYRALRTVNPSPYMFYLTLGETTVVGASPEVLVRLEDDLVEVRPIAGTRRRGANEAEDLALEEELLADEKERAEHIMLVDLGRNDIGRVCERGTVKVTEQMTVERYSHVMHIVSNVVGKLEEGKNAYDVLRAAFPAGTVSGAPKVRAMEIIDEKEPVRRGPYAGAVGYLGFDGNMDTCIAIRTLYAREGKLYLQVGAGIVADSKPEFEYEETINKARGTLRALEVARGGLL